MSASILAFSLGIITMLPICIGLYYMGRREGYNDGEVAAIKKHIQCLEDIQNNLQNSHARLENVAALFH